MLDDATPIWRYMSLAKLVALLSTRALHFTQIARFRDPYEATFARGNVDANRRRVMLLSSGLRDRADYLLQSRIIRQRLLVLRHTTFANCWHANEFESAAMWEVYSGEGIAVKSRIELLRGSIDMTEYDVAIRRVEYINYDTATIPADDPYSLALYKRISFEHEHEIRALLRHGVPDNTLTFTPEAMPTGINVGVDLERLVEQVYVAPWSPEWFLQAVTDVIETFGFKDVQVAKSSLDGPSLM